MALVEVAQGDITHEKVDAIVNPANEDLHHGGGCAAAISKAAGNQLDIESRNYVKAHGRLEVGKCTYTSAGALCVQGIKYVIHTVGPRFSAQESGV